MSASTQVCLQCNAVLPTHEALPLANGYVCADCDRYFRERPFPRWLKGGAIALAGVVAFSLYYNWRFIQWHIELIRVGRIMEAQTPDLEAAAKLAEKASKRVPEDLNLQLVAKNFLAMKDFVRAAKLLAEDGKDQEALDLITAALPNLPPPYVEPANDIAFMAKGGIAFEQKKYDQVLSLCEERLKQKPSDLVAWQMKTSTLGAKFAAGGDEALEKQCLDALGEVKKIAPKGDPNQVVFENRIEHRLATREIIDHKEFTKRFPNGWKPEAVKDQKP